MTTTFLLFDLPTTVGSLEVYLQNLKFLLSLRNLPAFEAEGFEAFKIWCFSERCPKEYVFDVCEVCENQNLQKNVPKEYTLGEVGAILIICVSNLKKKIKGQRKEIIISSLA